MKEKYVLANKRAIVEFNKNLDLDTSNQGQENPGH